MSVLLFCFVYSTCQIFQVLVTAIFPATCSFNICWDRAKEPAVPMSRSPWLHRKHFLFTQQMSWSPTWWKCHLNPSVARSSDNRWVIKVKTGSLWGKETWVRPSVSTFVFACVYSFFSFCPFSSSFCRLSPLAYFFPSQSFPQIKSKLKNEGSVGLYTYPVLQAADILLYKWGLHSVIILSIWAVERACERRGSLLFNTNALNYCIS